MTVVLPADIQSSGQLRCLGLAYAVLGHAVLGHVARG